MTTSIGIGFSNQPDVESAARQAAMQAKTQLQGDRIDLALIFYTIHYHPKRTLSSLQAVLNKTKMVGCCTAGLILSDQILTSGIAVLLIRSDDWELNAGSSGQMTLQDPHLAGTVLAQNIAEKFGGRGRNTMLFFADGHLINERLILKGMQGVLGNVFPIIGAGSCDDFRFRMTPHIYEDKFSENIATGVMFGGHSRVGVGGRHGWNPLGKPRTITGSYNNIMQSIDNKPAAHLYKEYFGDAFNNLADKRWDKLALLYPLGIFLPETNKYLIRNIVDILEDGSILCQGDIPVGHEVHIMISNKEACIEAASMAAEEARSNLLGQRPKLLLIFESMARLKLLGRNAVQEVHAIQKVFPDVPLLGMYTNGEIFPFQSAENIFQSYLQNENIVILAVS